MNRPNFSRIAAAAAAISLCVLALAASAAPAARSARVNHLAQRNAALARLLAGGPSRLAAPKPHPRRHAAALEIAPARLRLSASRPARVTRGLAGRNPKPNRLTADRRMAALAPAAALRAQPKRRDFRQVAPPALRMRGRPAPGR